MDESVEEQMPKIKHTELHINLDARIDRNFPIRHILFYYWEFGLARDLEDVKRRLRKYFYVLEPRLGTLVFTAPVKPTVIFVLEQIGERGGELMLINMDKYYSTKKLLEGLNMLKANVGIEIKGVWKGFGLEE
ncbi:MAG: hypothetical protein OD815_001486 [Candidatus Alkanophagales archaeon MCA70_species_2]|nr:hypothetical protein [Candidatus Alkanophaga liquidiphilum]